MMKYLTPLAIFVALAVVLGYGLNLKPSEVPSPLLNKQAPDFQLPRLHEPERMIARDDLLGQVWMFNVWASWCVACREEHPVLLKLARSGEIPIYGLNYKDKREDAVHWLERLGNPYVASAFDEKGDVGIDYGVYGVPETYIIDREGVIRHKHIGPINDRTISDEILPLLRELQG